MKTYTVLQTIQYPSWREINGIPYTVKAYSKAEAIKKARVWAWHSGHYGGQQGRRTFKVIAEENE